jgi:hypothetical protein
MPKQFSFFLGPENGVVITFTPSNRRLRFDGWSTDIMEIKGPSFRLATFLQELGITEDDVKKAFKEMNDDGTTVS